MRKSWLDGLLDTIADKGRDFLKTSGPRVDLKNARQLCTELASGKHGEASGIALARELFRAYEAMNEEQRFSFFTMLQKDFAADRESIRVASEKYLRTFSSVDYLELFKAVEAKRQELLRNMNMAPHGTASLVRMRADLLKLCKTNRELKVVDADFRHLLSSWFNRGFLKLHTISWDSSANILEKIIAYEAVHAIQGFTDLRRRLADDRRCFAFFHPALPGEPLIFVEVALVKGIARHIQPLINPQAPVFEAANADTAIFYSINNTQYGLRGISFGNFLIKQVVEQLQAELPQIKHFSTLSPLPRFKSTILNLLKGGSSDIDPMVIGAIANAHADFLNEVSPAPTAEQALIRFLEENIVHEGASALLQELAITYLMARNKRGPIDPVANFHLSNGARLHNINVFADTSENGMANSHGLMVNYLYSLDEVVSNHEAFVSAGRVALSSHLTRLERHLVITHKSLMRSRRKEQQKLKEQR